MQSLDPLHIRRKIRFEPESTERFLHPKCRLRRCARGDAQRDHIWSVKRLRWQVFESRYAVAQTFAEVGQVTVSQRQSAEQAKVSTASEVQFFAISCDLLDVFCCPLEVCPASGGGRRASGAVRGTPRRDLAGSHPVD